MSDIRDHLPGFEAHLLTQGRSPATARAYVADIRKFVDATDATVATYDTDAKSFVNGLRTNPSVTTPVGSILRYMSAIRSFQRYLLSLGMAVAEPFEGYRGPKPVRASAHPLPGMMVDVDAMVKAAWRPHHKVLIGLCGYAGLRVTEARSVTPRSLMRDHEGHWWLTVTGKGGAYREVPVADELFALLDDNAPEDPDTPFVPVGDRQARKAITEVAKRAGVTRGVSSHDLRHTFGTEIYSKTKDLRVTQELLGHASSQTTEGYTGVNAEAKRSAVVKALGA